MKSNTVDFLKGTTQKEHGKIDKSLFGPEKTTGLEKETKKEKSTGKALKKKNPVKKAVFKWNGSP